MMILNEQLGIPNNINKQASILYDNLVRDINKITNLENICIGSYDIEIGDEYINNMKFNILFQKGENTELLYLSLNYSESFEVNKSKVEVELNNQSFNIIISITDKTIIDDIVDIFNNDIKIEYIAHELQHLYNTLKQKRSLNDLSKYKSYTGILSKYSDNVKDFIYLLYYTSNIENIVRPVELYQMMLNDEVTKSQFLDYLKQTEVYEMLNRAKNFKVSDLPIDQLEDIFNDIREATTKNIEKSFQWFNRKLNIQSDIPFNRKEDEKRIFSNEVNRLVNKYKNMKVDIFFTRIKSYLNREGSIQLERLYKLHDLAINDIQYQMSSWNQNTKTYDLHRKISNKINERYLLKWFEFSLIEPYLN